MHKNWHNIGETEAVELLNSDLNHGLRTEEIVERRQKFGSNVLNIKKGKGPLVRFLLQFHQALVYILLVAIGVKLYLGGFIDAGVIFGVVLINAIIGYAQESKAISALAALSKALSTNSTVLRSGNRQQVDAKELVPGDIILLQSGDKIPADMRLVSSRELQIDESALTGESIPVSKINSTLESETSLADRTNMLYSSTLVTYGTGIGIVVETGDNTEIGNISKLLTNTEVLATPLTRKITTFSHVLLLIILGLAALTFFVGLWHGNTWENLFMASVALSVAMIPEGLPAVMTIILAIGVSRMAKRHAIIRHLPAVETLGTTTIICSDKTGTLTRNEMTVQELWSGNENFEISGIGYEPYGEITQENSKFDTSTKPALLELLKAGLLCNESLLKQNKAAWIIEGDPTEGALIVSAQKAKIDANSLSQQKPRLDTIPFESQYQYMATLHLDKEAGKQIVYLKGSVESVLERCSTILDANGEQMALNHESIYAQIDNMAKKGLRILAFARLYVDADTQNITHNSVADGLEFIGIQGMIDPPREEAIQSIAACQNAGIQVKMITGDHATTATAIALKMGLHQNSAEEKEVIAITGNELESLGDHELTQTVSATSVFARVTPEQKLRIVEALQNRGEIVAMTGDGVNDAPAVRKADIGIAMGITGTEVAKEAADMVLTDDNFASIEAAVEEGRGVLDNLIKFLSFILATNFGEGLVIIVAVLANETLPILPVQALWINMTAAVFLGLTLAFEPREPGLMKKSPRSPSIPILDGRLVFRILIVGIMLLGGSFGLFELALYRGASLDEARTIAVNVFAIGESFYLLNARSLHFSIFSLGLISNMWIWSGIFAMTTASLALTYLPIMNQMFHTAPIGLDDWFEIIAVGFIIYSVVAFEKFVRLRF